MSGFESSSFKKNIPQAQQGKQLREFTVGPPEGFEEPGTIPPQIQQTFTQQMNFGQQEEMSPGDLENAVREARRQKLANANKIGEAAKKRIELLANIGRLTKDVKIGDFVFSLRTLKSKETSEASLATFSTSLTNLQASYESRKQQLARSVYKIDGEDVAAIIGSNSVDDIVKFIDDNLEEVVVEKLWSEFIALKEEARSKYGINNEKDAEEVSEDLKK